MKLLCKCGNVEDIKTDKSIQKYEFKTADDATLVLVCKNCNEVVLIKQEINSNNNLSYNLPQKRTVEI